MISYFLSNDYKELSWLYIKKYNWNYIEMGLLLHNIFSACEVTHLAVKLFWGDCPKLLKCIPNKTMLLIQIILTERKIPDSSGKMYSFNFFHDFETSFMNHRKTISLHNCTDLSLNVLPFFIHHIWYSTTQISLNSSIYQGR